jgi:hypothetical protein
MPLDFCHPEAPHKKLRVPEWYVSSLMLDRALDAIVRRVKKLDHDHDIPYLAGYSKDGKTIYIDRHMPRTMKFRGREIDSDRFLILHVELSQTATESVKIISGAVGEWRKAGYPVRASTKCEGGLPGTF